ncbi:hypothetical protein [Streptomyces tateyamensis]|uniref:hypothetical protein n=1 Tax=Streptomyces tateyamensis TaxID=565073 RepID=UPI0011B6C9F5|nr:hypothetical protein [Streptomyces tateyamensis]
MKDTRDLQFWGTVVVVAAALAVVAAYLADGAPLVWAVASVEAVLVMIHVGRRFRPAGHGYYGHDSRPDSAHCDRCRRAREQRGPVPAVGHPYSGRLVGDQRDAHVLHDEGPEGEGVEDLVETEPTR